jgi:hypothetical protein
MGWYGLDLSGSGQGPVERALVNTVINFRLPYNVGNFLCGSETAGFSGRTKFHIVS